MHVAVSLTDRAPLGACVRCKKRKMLALMHAGANVCIRCLNNTPAPHPHHPVTTAQPPPKSPTAPTLPVDEDNKGPRPMHSETRNPSPHHHHTKLGRQQKTKDHSATARRVWKRPRKKTKTKNRSWNKCPDCGERACACTLTSSEDSESETREPPGTPTAPKQPFPRAPTPYRSTRPTDRNHRKSEDLSDQENHESYTYNADSDSSEDDNQQTRKAFEITPANNMRDKTKNAEAPASLAKEAFIGRRPNRLTPHRSIEVPNDIHSEPKDTCDKDEQ